MRNENETRNKENAEYFTASDGNRGTYWDYRTSSTNTSEGFSDQEAIRLASGAFSLSDDFHPLSNLGDGE